MTNVFTEEVLVQSLNRIEALLTKFVGADKSKDKDVSRYGLDKKIHCQRYVLNFLVCFLSYFDTVMRRSLSDCFGFGRNLFFTALLLISCAK